MIPHQKKSMIWMRMEIFGLVLDNNQNKNQTINCKKKCGNLDTENDVFKNINLASIFHQLRMK